MCSKSVRITPTPTTDRTLDGHQRCTSSMPCFWDVKKYDRDFRKMEHLGKVVLSGGWLSTVCGEARASTDIGKHCASAGLMMHITPM